MSKPIESPVSADPIDYSDPSSIFNACMWRMTVSDAEWRNSPDYDGWDLSREEAARRIDDEDYSNPFG